MARHRRRRATGSRPKRDTDLRRVLEKAEEIHGKKRTPSGAGAYTAQELLVATKELRFRA